LLSFYLDWEEEEDRAKPGLVAAAAAAAGV